MRIKEMSQKYPFARIAMAAPISNLGGSAFSGTKHPYASAPPSKKGCKVKRNMSDQFCTKRSCSESTEMHKDAGGWGIRPALNSGYSASKVPAKVVPVFVRKAQPKNGRFCDLGMHPQNGNKLTESRAKEALRLIESARERKRIKAYHDAQGRNLEVERSKAIAQANSLENAFKR